MAPHIYMSELEQRQILQQRTLRGHHCRMSFYDVYLDLMEKNRQDKKYWNATVHGKDMQLVKVSCGFFREEIPLFERFRHRMLWVSEWSVFENFVVILIVCNALVMAHPVAYDEESQSRGVQNTYFVFEILVSGVFTIELICRIIAYGFFFGDAPNPCFLKEPANWIDMMVVIFTLSEPFAAEVISQQDLRTMRVLRIFRVFRLVKSITFLPRLRNIVHSLSISMYRLWVSWLAIIFTLLVISLAGTDLWGDVYWRRCRLAPEPYSSNGTLVWPVDPSQVRFCGGRYECVPTAQNATTYCGSPVSINSGPIAGYDPWPELFENPYADYGFTGYQTLWSGLLTTFQVVNIDGWVNLLNRFEDAKWPGLSIPFFVILMLFGGLVLMNLILAILWYSFDMTVTEDRSHQGDYKLLMEAKSMDPPPVISKDIQRLPLHALVSSVQDLEVELSAQQAFHALDTEFRSMGIKNIFYSMITNPWFARVMNIIIIVNALTMCFDIYPPYDDTMLLILDNINSLCSLIFFAEVCVKIIGIGVSFFEDSGNRFDFLLVMLSVVELFMSGGSALSALRTARLLRIFRMIHMSMNLRILLVVFQMAVMPTLYFSMIVILFLYCACLAGMQIFYRTDVANPKLGLGFDSLGIGFLTSLAVFTGDGWIEITTTQIQNQENPLFGFFYFLLTFLLGKAVLKNLLLGIIAAEFRIARDRMKQDFRLRMAIAQAKLQKLKQSTGAEQPGEADQGEAEEDAEIIPESPRWPQQAFSRLEGTMEKTCARNMDVIKMIHVKGQAAKRLQELGKIHAMGKSKYAWYIVNFHGYYSTKVEATSVLQRNLRRDSNASTVAVPEEEEHGVFFFILMDRCDCTLYSLIQKTAFSEPEACFATEALLQGVTHLHNLRLVHRDIKDLNIMVADAGRKVCLGDFDLATSIPEKDTLIEWKGGTPGYMAPEVWSKGRGGFKADIFGVGVVLHVLLTRSNPFHPDEVSKPGNSGPLSYDIVRLFRSESSCELLYSLLAEDPELRPSAQEALDFSWLLGEEVVKSNLCKHVVKLGFASEDEGHEQTERPNGSRSLALWRRKGPEAGTKSPGVSGSSFFRTVSRTMRTARSILPFARRHSKIVPVPDLKEVDFDDVCLP